MTRHGKNCTNGMVYTYHEKSKDCRESGWGSKSMRLSKDSVKDFDCCCLTLQPCQDPVITPDGYLFDKAAILEYMIRQKREIARKLKEYEKYKGKKAAEQDKRVRDDQEKIKASFIASEVGLKTSAPFAVGAQSAKDKELPSVSNMTGGKDKELPSFWAPVMIPDSKEVVVQKPEEQVKCPMSGRALKMKDLITVKFTRLPHDDGAGSLLTKEVRYMCPVTNDVLGNSVPCAVLRPTGDVVTMECVEKIIKKDMTHPLTGSKLTEKDIIPLQRGASGFAGSGIQLSAKKEGPSMHVA